MMKRFCSLCKREINHEEIFYDVMITPKKGLESRELDEGNYYDDYCYDCTSNGKALVQLMKKRNDEIKKDK